MATTDTTHSDGTEFGSRQEEALRGLRRRSIDDVVRGIIAATPAIQEAWLFGGHIGDANRGVGSIGLIFVSESLHPEWMDYLPRSLDSKELSETQEDGHTPEEWEAIWRLNGLMAVTGHDVERVWTSGFPLFWSRIAPGELNVFVFPPNWKDLQVLERIQDSGKFLLPHAIPHPVEDVTIDAIEFNQPAGTFWPTES